MPGGVCAVLDYEVDQMAEFVAEMATRVVIPNAPVTAPFRKFVSQILTSTRLPKSTILLGMNYLAKRVNTIKQKDPYKATTEGQVWRMLTVALLLGSKFLDDNTFQNRSWSEVSGIAVAELNSLEHEWLLESNWGLYVNVDYSEDYKAWLKSWDDWKILKERAAAQANRERLSSLVPAIDTELARLGGRTSYSSWVQQQTAEYERYQTLKRNEMAQQQPYGMRRVDWSHDPWRNAPLTPPDSGYGTPEYLNSATSANSRYDEWFSSAQWNGQYGQPTPAQHAFYPYRPHGNYSAHYASGQGTWENGIAECSCSSCLAAIAAKQQPYFGGHSFGQPVMG